MCRAEPNRRRADFQTSSSDLFTAGKLYHIELVRRLVCRGVSIMLSSLEVSRESSLSIRMIDAAIQTETAALPWPLSDQVAAALPVPLLRSLALEASSAAAG